MFIDFHDMSQGTTCHHLVMI